MEIILTSWAPQDTVKFVKCPEWGTEGEGGVCEGGGSATPEYSRLIGDPPAKKGGKLIGEIRKLPFEQSSTFLTGLRWVNWVSWVLLTKISWDWDIVTRWSKNQNKHCLILLFKEVCCLILGEENWWKSWESVVLGSEDFSDLVIPSQILRSDKRISCSAPVKPDTRHSKRGFY